MEEYAEPVVVEGAEAVAAAFHLLHAQVQPFGRPVGGAGVVVGEDLGAPRGERLAQGAELGHLVGGAAGDGLVDERGGVGGGLGQVDVAHGLLASQAPTSSSSGSPTRRPSSM